MDRPLRIYMWVAFGITWGVGGLALLAGDIRPGGASSLHPLHYVAAFGPSIAGVVMAASTGGWAGVRRLLARVVPSWSSLPWYAAVLIGFPALNLVAARLLAPDFLARLPSWAPAPLPSAPHPRHRYRPAGRGVRVARLRPAASAPAVAPACSGPHPRRDLVGLAPAHVLHPGAVAAPALNSNFPREQLGVERDHDMALPANPRRLAAHDPSPRCGKLLRRDRRPFQRRGERGSRVCRIDRGVRRPAVASMVTCIFQCSLAERTRC
jgi:hypothetical protein